MKNEKIETVLKDVKDRGIKCEYDFLLHLYVILKSEGFPILLTELNALSGYSLRFLYDYEKPLLFNESMDYIKDNLEKFLGIYVQIGRDIPETPFILYPENLLIVRVENEKAVFYRNVFSEEKNLKELLNNNESMVSVSFVEVPGRKSFYSKDELARFIALMEKEFLSSQIEIRGTKVFSGKAAYKKFAQDLRNQAFSFSTDNGMVHPYLSSAVYPQWTALKGNISYLLGVHHFLNKKAREEMQKTVRYFENVLLFWREWERNVGRKSFVPPGKPLPMRNRRRAANVLEKASDAYMRGIESLKHIEMIDDR